MLYPGTKISVSDFISKMCLDPNLHLIWIPHMTASCHFQGVVKDDASDPTGRIVGLPTGGSGRKDFIEDGFDVTYATPFYWLFDECVKKRFPNACLY